jgi:hypothetical protein
VRAGVTVAAQRRRGVGSSRDRPGRAPLQREPVASKVLRSVGYDAGTSELEVEFTTGRVYRFRAVPEGVHAWLMRTPAKGAYFNRMIRDRYDMQEVTEPPPAIDLEAALRRSLDTHRE